MWDYSEKVLDHFHHPRNVGTLENPDGVGEVGALACGDALKLMFKLDKDGRIADVKFQTFGCASAIASSSALTEMIKGMTLEEAAKVTNADIAKYLDGLPEQKMHCSVMGMEALEAAIANYRTGDTTVRQLKDDPLVCTCFDVHESEIVEAIRINGLSTVEQVTNYTKAGGACGKCKGRIQAILDRELGKAAPAAAPAPAAPPAAYADLSPAKKVLAVEKVLESDVRPALRLDGGDIELVDAGASRVQVRFLGHCAGCMAAALTKNGLVEKKLREALGAPDLEVETV
ncbi:MAG: Fe-S cluster assembly protein NifU [Kiritimatiellae bacterium]|nr:Fe-S cluster assembly protein NifU [Kiritimatiellia bacterium]